MSSIGRIFVILNLILAAAFLGWASTMLSQGSEWKQKAMDAEAALTQANAEHEASIRACRLPNRVTILLYQANAEHEASIRASERRSCLIK